MQFCKMQSLGNDFMVVDAVTQKLFFSADQIHQLADRRRGIGFDQLLIVEPPYDPQVDFHYRIFNANGREVEQCGNGACAVAHFVRLKGLIKRSTLAISTQSGLLKISIGTDHQCQVSFPEPWFEPKIIPLMVEKRQRQYVLQLSQQTISCAAVSLGNPHAVLQVNDCIKAPVGQLGQEISQHRQFTQQANVGFMQILTPQHIRLRVYERGVGETPACGSGACAAVVCGIDQGLLASRVQVEQPGGVLQVDWLGPGHPLLMTSRATLVYEGWLP
ncbi:MAG: diaminopimelate epimerase [Candidatus Symbiodolus clandestinus]